MNKVVIIGCGNVGMSYAYALVNQITNVNELVLIDLDKERIEGEVMDLNHCLAFSPTKIIIKVGDYSDCKDATIVVLSAGANQLIGETRMDLIYKNSKIFKQIVEDVVKNGFKGIFLVATNPLDVMTYLTYKYSNFESGRVIGTGTSLDSARLKYLISEDLNINPKNIHACVIGEHGDSEFIPWSTTTLGLQRLDNMLDDNKKELIEKSVKDAAYKIIEKKGATYYGIGMCLVKITNCILNNDNNVITVSSYDSKNDIYYSMPSVINSSGVKERIYIDLTSNEEDKLNNTIKVIKEAINKL